MNLHPMKLVTVICEALAREPLVRVLNEMGAHGYTLVRVEGEGHQGARPGDIEEFGNIQVTVIVSPPVSDALLERLYREFFPRYAMVAHESDVRVMRPEKF